MEGSDLREEIKKLVKEVMQEMQITNQKLPVLSGVVTRNYGDGTFDVAAGGILFSRVSSPRQVTMSENVIVLSVAGNTIIL